MQEPYPAAASQEPPSSPGLSLDDIYYTIFRHKWKILFCSAAGFIAALGLVFVKAPTYVSEAKVLIRYVVDLKSTAPSVMDPQVKSPDSFGENIIGSEIEILSSLDLAMQVADLVGPEKILAKIGGGNSLQAAAGVVRGGLTPEAPRGGNVIHVSFSHPDPEIVQPVLSQVLDVYKKRHLMIHQQVGVRDDFLAKQAELERARLDQTEQELERLRTAAGVVSIEDAKKQNEASSSRIQTQLLTAEAELAERQAILTDLQKWSGTGPQDASAASVPPEIATRYVELGTQLLSLRKMRSDLLIDVTPDNPRAKRIAEQISLLAEDKKKMEEQTPALTSLPSTPLGSDKLALDLPAESIRVNSLMAKVNILSNQLARIHADAIRLAAAEPAIAQLERKHKLEQSKFIYFSGSLEQARDDESIGTGKITGIGSIQQPSPPRRDFRALKKPLMVALGGGVFGGLALAFLIDLVLDRSIKRSSELARRLAVPMFLSIPDLNRNGRLRLPRWLRNGKPKQLPPSEALVPKGPGLIPATPETEIAPWDPQHGLSEHFEALRDRLITYFEVRNMTHKPKLVGVTSCNAGAGVTTMAAGLAASLSETGEGNVLLVDMNVSEGAAYPFRAGRPDCGLAEVLQSEKPGAALVQDKLYMASVKEGKADDSARVLPQRFAHLVPQMKASDFDYIIFDLPPITQTSVTARLSRFMDIALVVVESEATGQELLKRAHGLLKESGVGTATVLNKTRAYVPKSLSQEI